MTLPVAAARDQQPVLDLPGGAAVVRFKLVLGRAEPQQCQRAGEHIDGAVVRSVAHTDDAERDPRQKQPVGPAEVLEVGWSP